MEYLIIIILLILTILILKIGLDIKIKDVKKIKEIGYDKSTNEIINNFPANEKICKDILDILDNKDVTIETTKDKKSQTSLYLVMQNKIIIANINNTFTRIQTIAHECIHSIQNKTLLKFNFIFSNFNILYFILICILAIFKVTNKEIENILLIGLILMQFIFFIVRSFLETDAMTRAEFLAKEYMDKKGLLNARDENIIVNKYKELNRIGIKLYNFMLACQAIIKPILFAIILLIF